MKRVSKTTRAIFFIAVVIFLFALMVSAFKNPITGYATSGNLKYKVGLWTINADGTCISSLPSSQNIKYVECTGTTSSWGGTVYTKDYLNSAERGFVGCGTGQWCFWGQCKPIVPGMGLNYDKMYNKSSQFPVGNPCVNTVCNSSNIAMSFKVKVGSYGMPAGKNIDNLQKAECCQPGISPAGNWTRQGNNYFWNEQCCTPGKPFAITVNSSILKYFDPYYQKNPPAWTKDTRCVECRDGSQGDRDCQTKYNNKNLTCENNICQNPDPVCSCKTSSSITGLATAPLTTTCTDASKTPQDPKLPEKLCSCPKPRPAVCTLYPYSRECADYYNTLSCGTCVPYGKDGKIPVTGYADKSKIAYYQFEARGNTVVYPDASWFSILRGYDSSGQQILGAKDTSTDVAGNDKVNTLDGKQIDVINCLYFANNVWGKDGKIVSWTEDADSNAAFGLCQSGKCTLPTNLCQCDCGKGEKINIGEVCKTSSIGQTCGKSRGQWLTQNMCKLHQFTCFNTFTTGQPASSTKRPVVSAEATCNNLFPGKAYFYSVLIDYHWNEDLDFNCYCIKKT